MAKIESRTVVEEDVVMGYVRTDMVGSKCTFAIAHVDEWREMSEEEAEEAAKDALHESGVFEWGY